VNILKVRTKKMDWRQFNPRAKSVSSVYSVYTWSTEERTSNIGLAFFFSVWRHLNFGI